MKTKNITLNEQNTPVSIHFDDIYFNTDDAIAETAYVFIEGNELYHRFLNHKKSTFTIVETGFGTGLSFLIAWQCFLQFKQKNPHHILQYLHFLSVEKYPLTLNEITLIYPSVIKSVELISLAEKLKTQWLTPHTNFDNQILLDIFFGDIGQFPHYLKTKNITINACFFDGFSPAKNPEMWSEKLFKEIYQLMSHQGSFATFTAASFVRKNLINARFIVEKKKGFGKKREMLVGHKPSIS